MEWYSPTRSAYQIRTVKDTKEKNKNAKILFVVERKSKKSKLHNLSEGQLFSIGLLLFPLAGWRFWGTQPIDSPKSYFAHHDIHFPYLSSRHTLATPVDTLTKAKSSSILPQDWEVVDGRWWSGRLDDGLTSGWMDGRWLRKKLGPG